MATGITALRKIQLGRQTVATTAVPATTIWRGPAIFSDDEQKKVRPKEDVGLTSGTTQTIHALEVRDDLFPVNRSNLRRHSARPRRRRPDRDTCR